MNPRPIIVASAIAMLFVVAVYFVGKFALEQGHIEDTSPPTVSKPKGQVDKTPAPTTDNSNTTNTSNDQQTSVTQHPAPTVDTKVDNSPAEAETPESTTPATSTEQVRMSLFGLGPLPEVPADFPDQDIWDDIEMLYNEFGPEKININIELKARVEIKLFIEEGKTPVGTIMENGLVCPLYPDVVYVTWEEFVNDDGTVERYASRLSGPGNLISREDYNAIENGIIPDGITVIPHSEGIDPYEYLNLP